MIEGWCVDIVIYRGGGGDISWGMTLNWVVIMVFFLGNSGVGILEWSNTNGRMYYGWQFITRC